MEQWKGVSEGGQSQMPYVDVLTNALGCATLGDDHETALDAMANEDLAGCFPVTFGYLNHAWNLQWTLKLP